MTRREWMLEHHPDCVAARHGGSVEAELEGGCYGCPWEYGELPGTEEFCDPDEDCEVCWTREVPNTGKGAGSRLEIARRAVSIAARIMTAAEMCIYENRSMCINGELSDTACDKCIEEWLLDKAETELRNARNAEIRESKKEDK